MDIKVQIISRETIKPSSPTPQHLRTHKLCLLDQLAMRQYIPIILFYSITGENSDKQCSNHLKTSLAQTLTYFYPFAGRAKNGHHIDCNDDGATYVEASVAGDISTVLEQSMDVEQLKKLLPCHPEDFVDQSSNRELVAVQVNHFTCGGIALGVCIDHSIADGSTAATFVKSWSAIATGTNAIDDVIFDCTSIFPPIENLSFAWDAQAIQDVSLNAVTKRFVFDGFKIAALREKIGNTPSVHSSTRFEAVAALIWGALIAVARESDVTVNDYMAGISVNVRNRNNPPLPPNCIGNLSKVAIAHFYMQNTTNYNELAGKIRESIRKMYGEHEKRNEEYIRQLNTIGGDLDMVKSVGKESEKGPMFEIFTFSSWCRFPFYEADFGWGKPIWVGTAQRINKVAIFVDTRDGKGIEAWVGLPKEQMAKFEQHLDIVKYSSIS